MELLQLKYFCDAAESENFSKTAAKFGVPTSNILQTVKRLEKELGICMFERESNKIKLNEKGKLFYECARNALNSLKEAKERLADDCDAIIGEIRLLVLTNRRIVTMAIERFRTVYPDVTFVLSHKADKNEIDYHFCISDAPPDDKKSVGELLLTESLLLASRKGTVDPNKSTTAELLRSQRFVSMGEGTRLHAKALEICRSYGVVPEIAVETDDPYYVRKYVEMGIGVAIVPSISWRGLFTENIELKDFGGGTRNTFVFYDKSKHLGRAAMLFLEILKSTFKYESECSSALDTVADLYYNI